MYSISDFGAMIGDRERIAAFAEALRRVITPQSVVIDIGTGTGIFALLACRFGARRVYAIEPSPAIQVAREIAAANGYADRISFLEALSTDVELPERGDVIVSDLGGLLPWFGTHLPAIINARRFLSDGGVLIPQRDSAWAAVIEAPDTYAKQTAPWEDGCFELDMSAARRLAVNSTGRCRITADQLLTESRQWAVLDYARLEDANIDALVRWTATRGGDGHGIVVGFDRTLADGIRLCNAPDRPGALGHKSIYATVFFPWESPVRLAAGDYVEVRLRATLVDEEYIWNWTTSVGDGPRPSAMKARFAQSTLIGMPLSPAALRKASASYVPTLTENGRMARFVLDAMSRGLTLSEIAARLSSEFSTSRVRDPLSYVAALARQYG
jgi:protein arginine N-methyltransferase 1